jgi:hypothetical protein
MSRSELKSHTNLSSGLFEIFPYPGTNITRFGKNHIKIRSYCYWQKNKYPIKIDIDRDGTQKVEHRELEDKSDEDESDEDESDEDESDEDECECNTNHLRHFVKNEFHYPLESLDLTTTTNIKDEFIDLEEFAKDGEILKFFQENSKPRCNWKCQWGQYEFSMWDSRFYILCDAETRQIFNILYAPNYELQLGDDKTIAYLVNNKHLLVWNDGDVYSTIYVSAKT